MWPKACRQFICFCYRFSSSIDASFLNEEFTLGYVLMAGFSILVNKKTIFHKKAFASALQS
jgi:hypothetical protein